MMLNLKSAWNAPRLRYMLLAGIIIAGFLLLLWRGGLFMSLRMRLNDVYYAPAQTTDRIRIIAIDDASLTRFGRTPVEWSRDVYTELIGTLASSNPRVIAIDVLFSEELTADVGFAAALNDLRQNETRTRIVLAGAGINVIADTSAIAPHSLAFTSDLPLSPAILAGADYRGYTNAIPDIDGVVRRQPSLIQVDEETQFSFSLAAYLAYLRIPAAAAGQVIAAGSKTPLAPLDRHVIVDEFGFWLPYFYGPPSTEMEQTFPFASLIDVMDGKVDPAFFEDKIVLLGLTNHAGALDKYPVPSSSTGGMMSGVEIQANAIESLMQDAFIVPLSDAGQATVIVLLVLFSSLVYVYPRWYFKIALAVLLVAVWFVFTSVVFSATFISITLFDTLLALILPLAASIGIDITIETTRRRQKEFLLSSLQHIAEQRLQLRQAADYILADVQKIAPGVMPTLYLCDPEQVGSYQQFRINEQPVICDSSDAAPLLKRYHTATSPVRDTGTTMLPLTWQGKQQGLLILEHARQPHLDAADVRLLQEMVEQLAPNIDNMQLFSEIQRQKSLLDAVFAESPAGIAIIDGSGRIVQSNQVLASLLELSQEDIHGHILPDLIAQKAEDENLGKSLLFSIQSRLPFNVDEVTLGEESVRIDVTSLQNYDLSTVVVGDVTALVELGKLKTQMLRIASHDLKNPLSRVIGFAELIEMDGQLDEENQRFLTYIQRSGEEMLQIITDILNLERLRSGKSVREPVNLNLLINQVCASHQPDVIQKQQVFEIDLPELPIIIQGDTAQLSQAVTNLVGNAVKYTPDRGKISVHLKFESGIIRLDVQDTGYGIPQSAQDKLFTEFYRVKSKATSHISGTGLGLSLVRSVIEAHGGTVGFSSEEGKGSTFYFILSESTLNEFGQKV